LIAASFLLPTIALADDSFQPLTSLPGVSELASNPSFPAFLNNMYRIGIGVAALLALVEIVLGGYILMTGTDSISARKKARTKISNAIIGLVLVLTPYVVFSVINPRVVNDISLDFSGLKGKATDGVSDSSSTLWVDQQSTRADAQKRCSDSG